MNPERLNLQPHPEGGRFREVHRSPDTVLLPDGRTRTALTHIYFHLAPGEISRLHRVEQEEVWNLYHGALRLHLLTETGQYTRITLSPEEQTYCAIIPAGTWQAAEPLQGGALVGCTVAPGFDFADFQLLSPGHPLIPLAETSGLHGFL